MSNPTKGRGAKCISIAYYVPLFAATGKREMQRACLLPTRGANGSSDTGAEVEEEGEAEGGDNDVRRQKNNRPGKRSWGPKVSLLHHNW